jgi:PAP2 superfamily
MLSIARARRTQAGALLPAKPVDILMLATFSACAVCAAVGRSGSWEFASAVFIVLALAPIALRSAVCYWRAIPLRLFVDLGWPVIAVILAYGNLDPVADCFHLPLADARLQAIDEHLFGTQLSVAIAPHVGPLASDLLMLCYASYYLWPFLLGVFLYALRGQEAFDRWCVVILSGIFLNYICYVAVPAVGPRFAQVADFHAPVAGAIGGPMFEAFLHSPYKRDCFPSGHTAAALLVLYHAYRHLRSYFWFALLPCLGLIFATVALRFHYGIDLLAAVPFAVFANFVGQRLHSAMARGRELIYAREAR